MLSFPLISPFILITFVQQTDEEDYNEEGLASHIWFSSSAQDWAGDVTWLPPRSKGSH